jgi:hypothetical protein
MAAEAAGVVERFVPYFRKGGMRGDEGGGVLKFYLISKMDDKRQRMKTFAIDVLRKGLEGLDDG